jgi:hypothetical protein
MLIIPVVKGKVLILTKKHFKRLKGLPHSQSSGNTSERRSKPNLCDGQERLILVFASGDERIEEQIDAPLFEIVLAKPGQISPG